MRHTTRILTWAGTALAFALAACLAIGTAAIKSSNVHARRAMQRAEHEIAALEANLAVETAAWRKSVAPERLAAQWVHCVERWRSQ